MFLNDDLINHKKEETNRYRRAKDPTFADTGKGELSKFIGLCIQMGLVKLPSLRDYWSTRPALGGHSIAGKIMPEPVLKNCFDLYICATILPQMVIDCIKSGRLLRFFMPTVKGFTVLEKR